MHTERLHGNQEDLQADILSSFVQDFNKELNEGEIYQLKKRLEDILADNNLELIKQLMLTKLRWLLDMIKETLEEF